jgi:hypothetical protein
MIKITPAKITPSLKLKSPTPTTSKQQPKIKNIV